MYEKIKKFRGRVPFPPKKHAAAVPKEAQLFIEGTVDRREEKIVHQINNLQLKYITYYLKAAALLLNALERQRVSSRPAYYSMLVKLYIVHYFI